MKIACILRLSKKVKIWLIYLISLTVIFYLIFRTSLTTTTSNFQSFLEVQAFVTESRQRRSVVFYKALTVGYGNRIYSLLSAFMLAVITDSALLIDWPDIQKEIETPLSHAFNEFNDWSFLDRRAKWPHLCNLNATSQNTWTYLKRLDTIEGFSQKTDKISFQILILKKQYNDFILKFSIKILNCQIIVHAITFLT